MKETFDFLEEACRISKEQSVPWWQSSRWKGHGRILNIKLYCWIWNKELFVRKLYLENFLIALNKTYQFSIYLTFSFAEEHMKMWSSEFRQVIWLFFEHGASERLKRGRKPWGNRQLSVRQNGRHLAILNLKIFVYFQWWYRSFRLRNSSTWKFGIYEYIIYSGVGYYGTVEIWLTKNDVKMAKNLGLNLKIFGIEIGTHFS